MQVRVLGSFELVVDGQVRPVPGPGERALLALLASDPGRIVAADRLIDELWGEGLPGDPTNSLQLRVSKVRKVVGTALVTQRPGYRLEIEPDQVDAVRFARMVGERRFEEALALWRGEPYGEFADQEWARAEAARLTELGAIAVESHVEARLAVGEHAAIIPELTALIPLIPARGVGRSADARPAPLRPYACRPRRVRDYRQRLDDTLGLTPSAELRGLETAIIRRDVALEPDGGSSRAPDLPVPLDSLVGRNAELEQIAALSSRGRLITLVGPGGVGKTRLAIAAARAAAHGQPHGACFVPLANVSDPGDLAAAIAEALGLSGFDDSSPEQLITAWLSAKHSLLVLDNCEHVVDAAAHLAERLLAAAPRLRITATSREALGVSGEIQRPVAPLPRATRSRCSCNGLARFVRTSIPSASSRCSNGSASSWTACR